MQRVKNRWMLSILMLVTAFFCVPQQGLAQDQSLFWSIESEQGHAGYLLGTIHSEDPRVLEYSRDLLAALQGSSQFAMELVPNLPTLAKLATAMLLPEDTELASIIGDDRYESVIDALSPYGIPDARLAKMQPWAVMITLSVPAPETGLFMDFSLSLRASGSGLKVIGLETIEEQLSFLQNMPLEHQLVMLDQAVLEIDRVQEVHDQMVSIYLKGDLSILLAETETQLSELGKDAHDYFVKEGIIHRNHRMLKAMLLALESGTLFAAVGSLHLPGEDGLINLLRNSGYQLKPMPSPFPRQQ